ncbi:MAG: ABC transporter ATP-binding protein [Magnetococcales bacterium]|nr:ABC transporter ATP-binding protein [Magnetococcales bacterium]
MNHTHLLHLDRIIWQGAEHAARQPPLLDGIDWSIGAGERWAIVGGEGSGKSTLLRLMVGLLRPEQGEVRWQGQPVSEGATVAAIGVLFSDAAQRFLTPNVWEEIALTPAHQGILGEELQQRVAMAMQQAGLEAAMAKRELATLSTAQAYRVAVAALLAMQPTLLLLDEPGSVLDEAGEAALAACLRPFSSITLTSRLSRARLFADRLAWLESGQLRVET